MKLYNTMMHVGRSKYVVNSHDGVATHRDGSPFFGIAIFKSKKANDKFITSLHNNDYKYGTGYPKG